MARATRSSDPLPGIEHGITGFDKGCGCIVCRAAKRDAQAKYRDTKRGVKAGIEKPANSPSRMGKMEALTWAEIQDLGTELSAEQNSLANLALINARLVDTIEKDERWHLLNATTRTLRETMKELRGTLPKRKPADEEGEGDDLNLQGFGR